MIRNVVTFRALKTEKCIAEIATLVPHSKT